MAGSVAIRERASNGVASVVSPPNIPALRNLGTISAYLATASTGLSEIFAKSNTALGLNSYVVFLTPSVSIVFGVNICSPIRRILFCFSLAIICCMYCGSPVTRANSFAFSVSSTKPCGVSL